MTLLRGHVPVDLSSRHAPEMNPGAGLGASCTVAGNVEDTDSGEDFVPPARQALQHHVRLFIVCRLSQYPILIQNNRVSGNDQARAVPGGNFRRFRSRHSPDVPRGQLPFLWRRFIKARRVHAKSQAEARQDLPSSRGGGGKDQFPGCVRRPHFAVRYNMRCKNRTITANLCE